MITSYQKPNQLYVVTGIVSILLLLFLFSLLGTSPVLNLFALSKINATVFFVSRLLSRLSIVLLWLYSTKAEKQPMLIWKEQKYTFSAYLLSIIAMFAILFAGLLVINLLLSLTSLNKNSSNLSEIIAILSANKLLLLFTALTAGVVEELIFRGYLQPRLEIIFKNPYIAMLVSSLLFGLLHYKYGTVTYVIGPFFIGFVFAYCYWKYRNIKMVIICHFLWDLLAFILLIKARP